MRLSKLFGRTLREAPTDVEGIGHQLLVRAAFVRSFGAGRYAYLPLGQRSLENLESQVHRCLAEHASQNLWLSGAIDGTSLAETARTLAGSDIQSYRQLPTHLAGAGLLKVGGGGKRGGPLSAREAPGALLCSFTDSDANNAQAYAATQHAFGELFQRCGLAAITARDALAPAIAPDRGSAIGHAYLFPTTDGGETSLLCDACGYAALADIAAFARPVPESEPIRPLAKVPTPHCATIADLAQYLNVSESRTAKAVLLMATLAGDERFVFVVVRGDMDLSERKLCLALRAGSVRPATEAEIRAAGATPGYASPIGLKNVLIVVDELIPGSPNLVAGANDEGFHLSNTNYGRDYAATLVADIAAARPGDGCPSCSARLRAAPVAVLGRSSQLAHDGAKGAPSYLDATGRMQPVCISTHYLDLGCLLAAAAEQHHDEHGLVLPPPVSPFAVHLVGMPGAEAEAEALVDSLAAEGITCLYDDRGESAGVKFTDADLIGLPLRITLGKRSLQSGGAEFKRRDQADKVIIPLGGVVQAVRAALAGTEEDVMDQIEELPYGEHLR